MEGPFRSSNSCSPVFPSMSAKERQDLIYRFFPFIYGVHPYTTVTEKQKEAMKATGVEFHYLTVYEITRNCLMQLLPMEET